MCLAIPMRVVGLQGGRDDLLDPLVAVVEAEGMQRQVRLDLVDRMPRPGDYLIIHAGFAIHTLDSREAEANLRLMQEMADALGEDGEP